MHSGNRTDALSAGHKTSNIYLRNIEWQRWIALLYLCVVLHLRGNIDFDPLHRRAPNRLHWVGPREGCRVSAVADEAKLEANGDGVERDSLGSC